MNYSVLLPTCNRPKLVERFLHSLNAQTLLPHSLIVIDQSDNDDTKNIVSMSRCPVTYIHRTIKSLILSRNIGIDASTTELVAFFDDDLILEPDFCEHMVNVFKNNPKYAGGMGTIHGFRYHKRPFQRFFLMPHEADGKFLKSGCHTYPHWKQEFCETEFLSGGITFWKREILKQYKFDERLKGYGHGDDVDVSYRISRNFPLFFEPKAKCFHEEHSPGREKGRMYRRGWIQNMYYLCEKNGCSKIAFYWCVLGHILRDLFCRDFYKVQGDFEGLWKIWTNSIDTVEGYQSFKASRI